MRFDTVRSVWHVRGDWIRSVGCRWRHLLNVDSQRRLSAVTPFLWVIVGRPLLAASAQQRPSIHLDSGTAGLFAMSQSMSSGYSSTAAADDQKAAAAKFQPKKVLILSKMTRLDFEKRRHDVADVDDEPGFGPDFKKLREQHNSHYTYLKRLCHELSVRSVECKVVQRWDYNPELINWADAVFSAGGDGTYLLAASKICDRNKPLIGINTDPTSSEGYLCLMKKRTEEHLPDALDRLFAGDFSWMGRQRIRVTLMGKNVNVEPLELYDQQLRYPEFRWAEHVREYEDVRLRGYPSVTRFANPTTHEPHPDASNGGLSCYQRTLPYLALNDVFIGESLSSRVSYYDLQVDGGQPVKQKSSGITICTGTGSTSWYFNINKLTETCVQDLLTMISDEVGTNLPFDKQLVSKICKRFNEKLVFSPEDSRMAYAVRDPVFNATFLPFPPRGFSRKIVVHSRGFDSHLVIDGGMSYMFGHGTEATLEINPDDALKTVVFR